MGVPIQTSLFRSNAMVRVDLYDHQRSAIDRLGTGSILCGGVGSGKSRTALAYFYRDVCGVSMSKEKFSDDRGEGYEFDSVMGSPKDLYIITTPKKRDSFEWDAELANFELSRDSNLNPYLITVQVDSWNNIAKYTKVKNAFFIFDEQRAVGSGTWGQSLIAIAKKNQWIMLSATPGDVWMDYCTVFIANGFYRNKSEFVRRHVVYDPYAKYPRIKRYIDTERLERLRDRILVSMPVERHILKKKIYVPVEYNKKVYREITKKRWNIFESAPIKDAGEYCRVVRRLVNSDPTRLEALGRIVESRRKVIVFYSNDYERELIHRFAKKNKILIREWSGHRHDELPDTDEWIFLVQYTAGAEGWNCITTNTVVFYSQSYSYKAMTQAAGRIDRLNTPYSTLYYYYLISQAPIDGTIKKCLDRKKSFNVRGFVKNLQLSFDTDI